MAVATRLRRMVRKAGLMEEALCLDHKEAVKVELGEYEMSFWDSHDTLLIGTREHTALTRSVP